MVFLCQANRENKSNITGEYVKVWPASVVFCLSGAVMPISPCKGTCSLQNTHWLTYAFSCTWRYTKDLEWLLCATHTHTWPFEHKEKPILTIKIINKMNNNKTEQKRNTSGGSPRPCKEQMPTFGITEEEMRTKLWLIVEAVNCVAVWVPANATGKVTGHFHLDLHINPLLSRGICTTSFKKTKTITK